MFFILIPNFFNFFSAIRECLRFDPDHKGCFTHYKYVKKIAAQLKLLQTLMNEGKYDECVTKAESAITLETKVPHIMYMLRAKHCKCLNKVLYALVILQTSIMIFCFQLFVF